MISQNISTGNNFQFQKRVFAVFLNLVFVLTLFSQGNAFGAASDIDPGFIATPSLEVFSGNYTSSSVVLQPDGKTLLVGNFNSVGAVPRNRIARLNSDGSVDNGFYCSCDLFSYISSAVVQPDGKIIVAGGFGFGPYPRIARLNPDGSLDNSFLIFGGQSFGGANVWAIQPDGKVLISQSYNGFHMASTVLRRLNTDGSLDNSFNPLTFDSWNSKDVLAQLKVLPDGKTMIGGKHAFGYIFRINADGTKDMSFESPALTATSQPQIPPHVAGFAIQSTGKIVFNGNFSTVNGLSRSGIARLNTDGSLDLGFTPPFPGTGKMETLSGDRILLGGVRLNADGTVDNTFAVTVSFDNWAVDASERVTFSGEFTESGVTFRRVGRLNPDGSIDNSFNITIVARNGEVMQLGIQPDGKVLLAGNFQRVNGAIRTGLARVNSNGSLDSTFAVDVAGYAVSAIAAQTDGKTLIGGTFAMVNGVSQTAIARLNADGSLDSGFDPVLPSGAAVYAIELQADGKILIGGFFSSVDGTSRTGLARLNTDGSLDAAFNPIIGSPVVNSVLVQADGKIMFGGTFSGVNGFNRSNLARLNADSSLDTAFNAGSIQSLLRQIVRTPDGKYLVLGFSTIFRRNADGTADDTFPSPTVSAESGSGNIRRFLRQPDGSIVIVGKFSSVNNTPRINIARIKPDGFVDTTFLPVGTDSYLNASSDIGTVVNTIIAQTDGKLIIGGGFSTVENVARSSIARIIPAAAQQRALFDFDGDGKSDVSVFRPSENKWYVLRSSDLTVQQFVFAIAGDVPVPADYDGDGKTDFAIFRPSSGDWWSLSSRTGGQVYAHWGANGDIPRPSDFDGDGRADYVVYRPSENNWYRISSANGASSNGAFGLAGDKPVTGDFDGDGKSDKAIFRPSNGDWWYQSSINGAQLAVHWGISTDIPAPADFDGDGKTDFAVYRPSTGVWYIINSSNFSFTIMHFGISEDKPVPADYDGDGKADIAVFRPSTGAWYLQRTTAGFWGLSFGISTDIPTENAFIQ
jgi:uncharacterized delta-60 repeat protein